MHSQSKFPLGPFIGTEANLMERLFGSDTASVELIFSGLIGKGANTENWRSVVRIPAWVQIFLSKLSSICPLDIQNFQY